MSMSFDKVETRVDFSAQERWVLDFWRERRIFEKLKAKNAGKPPWSFLDGPITANNPMGVHHAWGRSYKDLFNRYFAMTGHELRYQNGFDCQGLWVEVEVEKELGLGSKRDIENLVPGDRFASIDRFVELCKQRVDRFAKVQQDQSVRLGYWMDWDDEETWSKRPDDRRSYFTMADTNNYTIWSFLKKCMGRGLVYRGYDSMPWCPRCAVGISQMEMHEGYQLVAHRAVFVRFPLRGRPGENLLVWTTTPWTLSSNVAAAVHPELTYARVQHGGEIYYVAQGALTANRLEEDFKRGNWVKGVPKLRPLAQVFKEKGGFEIVGEVKGSEMIGWAYDGPFDELEAQDRPRGYPDGIARVVERQGWAPDVTASAVHRVIAWDMVGETEGTGIVHIAPGCGKEDFELGKAEGLPPVAPLDEEGTFLPAFGPLAGRSAIDPATTELILENLKEKGLLVASERYPHKYPHCWRCKTELLFRLVDEWYIDMSWREEIMRVVETATFLPASINGKARELDWLRNMGDWMISKKRYWGLALPIWECADEACGWFDVIGGRDELKERAVEGWEGFEGHSPHRPWIDLVKVTCAKCGGAAHRIPDVGNPWLDAGIVPYSTMRYGEDREYWEKWFPADFITESFPGQFRNWFYAILAMSAMMEGKAPFKVLLGHALVRDEHGEEMHKSKGNSIPFEDAAEKISSDLMRWMYARHNPAANINFGYGPAEELRNKFTLKLWNTYAFFTNYARLDGFDPNGREVPVANRPDIDRWILSDLQLLVRTARESFERYDIQAFCLAAEEFVDEKLSNWYVRRNRRRFWRSESDDDKLAAYQTLYTVLETLARLFAPVMPFLSEALHQNLVVRGGVEGAAESVHLTDFPVADESLVDPELSADMQALLRLVTLGLSARNNAKIKVRQPLAEMRVEAGSESDTRAVRRFADQLREELNVRSVALHDGAEPLLTVAVRANAKALGPKLGARLKEVQEKLAAADAPTVAARVHAGEHVDFDLHDGPVTLEPGDVSVSFTAPDGWVGVNDRATRIAIDIRITDELKREGIARDVVRQVQELRKQASLEMDDRIALFLGSESEALREAIVANRDYIAGETLAAVWSAESLGDDARREEVTVDGQKLVVELRRAVDGS
jgi:isoleucyl-tRNA synthetase